MGLLTRSSLGFVLMVLMQSRTVAFTFMLSTSVTHGGITRYAILNATLQACKEQALQQGKEFVEPKTLTEESLVAACSSPDLVKGFKRTISKIRNRNAWVDIYRVFNAEYHFDDESFLKGRDLITNGMSIVKASVKQQNYETAREKLGEILHTLQDFYSHSNWIELGNMRPYSNLIKPNSKIENIADSETCRSCVGNDCTNNILENIITEKKLTSGYFAIFSSSKPKGKCSHGGFLDRTKDTDPKGGINKDSTTSEHGNLHNQAAGIAIAASTELLEDIRAAIGDSEFLRLMGFTQKSVLCFVIDTTSSMSDDIAEVKRVTASIIDRKLGSVNQPSEYILVPFNDPDFGPLTRTTDPNTFKSKVNALTASGGGDIPELCLTGLQLALTGSPPQSEIFVFTDANAKDTWLKSTVLALIERTKSSLNFMLTNALSARRRRSGERPHTDQSNFIQLSNPLNKIYHDLAQASGGQAIEVTKETLSQATSIIGNTIAASLVTVLQAVRNPAKAETFSFLVDSSLQDLTIYITGNSLFYNITNPSGASQSSDQTSGDVGIIQTVDNFQTVHPNIADVAGVWLISMNSEEPYTIEAFGKSPIDFLFDFVELSDNYQSYAVLNSRPAADGNLTLIVSMVGGDTVRPTEVALIGASNSNAYNGTLKEVAFGMYLATFDSVPAGGFFVRVTGMNTSRASNGLFQRQSSIQLQTSSIKVTAQAPESLEPGKTLTLPFTVTTTGSGGNFSISVSNDRNLTVIKLPSSLTLEDQGSANGTITLPVPGNTPSGSEITVTIEAAAPGGKDFNYAVLRLAVAAPVTDITPPVCEVVSINANCLGNCSLSSWELLVNMSDSSGVGIQSVTIRQGVGSLNTSSVLDQGVNITMAFYTASCCFPQVELVMVDAEGNVGLCYKSLVNNGAQHHPVLPTFMWLNLGIILYQFMQL
ncbi:von Willebrand factor A domain-containing protein 7-like isoform X2 [Hoplias malabaricus]|uniref:von Willebrand factor A domain-containing protein 7-like isoform X2 n=1 Tax=Hoplias malabaricus TaxID=27720 RepID=UPI00346212ED